MSIQVNLVGDNQFPIEITINNKMQKYTNKAAKELKAKLDAAIDAMVLQGWGEDKL